MEYRMPIGGTKKKSKAVLWQEPRPLNSIERNHKAEATAKVRRPAIPIKNVKIVCMLASFLKS